MLTFDGALNQIIDAFTTPEFYPEIQKARKEYFDTLGEVHEEDPFFETYMTSFVEWYIFDRDLSNHDLAPVKLFYRNHKDSFNESEKNIFGDFTKFRHSLFLVKKVSPSRGIQVEDLYDQVKFMVGSYVPSAIFSVGQIFEAIFVPFQGDWIVTKTFFNHPTEAKKLIIKEMKKIRNLDLKILAKTVMNFKRLRLKLDRYPHVPPQQVYGPP